MLPSRAALEKTFSRTQAREKTMFTRTMPSRSIYWREMKQPPEAAPAVLGIPPTPLPVADVVASHSVGVPVSAAVRPANIDLVRWCRLGAVRFGFGVCFGQGFARVR